MTAAAHSWLPAVGFLAAFAASRALAAACGLAFCSEHAAQIMHFPELELLRDRLFETAWHLHGQPPGPSLVLGALLKLAGDDWPRWAAWLFHGLGALAGLSLLAVLRELGVRAGPAVAVALGFVLLPSVLVYEHYAFTTLPVAALLLAAAVPLVRSDGTSALWAVLFLLVAALVLNVRNVFHLVWWVACFLLVLRTWRGSHRALLLATVLPALVAVAPYAKTALVHGRFEASSWSGFGLARKTYHQDDLAVRADEALRGRREPIQAVPVFGSVEEFALVVPAVPPTGVPVLDRPRKANGFVNYHHALVAEASARMRAAAWADIRNRPERYAADVLRTVPIFFAPSSEWRPVATPRAQLGAYATAIDGVLHTPWFAGLGLWAWGTFVVLLASVPAVWRVVRRGPLAERADVVIAFAVGTYVYLALAAVLLDTNEVMRHRLKVDGLLLLAAAVLVFARVQRGSGTSSYSRSVGPLGTAASAGTTS